MRRRFSPEPTRHTWYQDADREQWRSRAQPRKFDSTQDRTATDDPWRQRTRNMGQPAMTHPHTYEGHGVARGCDFCYQ